MTWAATWMYQATKQPTYLNDAISYYVLHSQVHPLVTPPVHLKTPTGSEGFFASSQRTS